MKSDAFGKEVIGALDGLRREKGMKGGYNFNRQSLFEQRAEPDSQVNDVLNDISRYERIPIAFITHFLSLKINFNLV